MRWETEDTWFAYEYDAEGRLIEIVGGVEWDDVPRRETLEYDSDGRLTLVVASMGENVMSLDTTTIEYDDDGRVARTHLVREFLHGGDPNYERACSSSYGSDGALISVDCTDTHGDQSERFGYDSVGRLSEYGDWEGTTTLEYDDVGRLARGIPPDAPGGIQTYGCD